IYINLHFFTTEITRYSDLEYRRNNNNRYESSMEVIDDFISQTKDQEFIDKAAKLHVLINTYCSNKKDYKILALTINDMIASMYATLRYKDHHFAVRHPKGFLDYKQFNQCYDKIEKEIIKDMDLGHIPINDKDIIKFAKEELHSKIN